MTRQQDEQPIDTTPTTTYPLGHRVRIDKPYVPSHATDIRETFERARRGQQEQTDAAVDA